MNKKCTDLFEKIKDIPEKVQSNCWEEWSFFFLFDHITEVGMKAALRAQQARFEQKRNLFPVKTGRHAVWHFWSF